MDQKLDIGVLSKNPKHNKVASMDAGKNKTFSKKVDMYPLACTKFKERVKFKDLDNKNIDIKRAIAYLKLRNEGCSQKIA